MVAGVSVAKLGVGDVVGVGVDVSVSRLAVMVLVRVRWIVDLGDATVEGSMSVWVTRGAMLTLARRVARDEDGGVLILGVLGWLGQDWGVRLGKGLRIY